MPRLRPKFFFILLVIMSTVWVLFRFAPSSSTRGRLAPVFTVTLIEGREFRLRDLRGKVVLLNFWASWCAPCQAEARDLEATWREYKDRGVVFLGINIQNDKAQHAHRFLKEFGITYSNGRDNGVISGKYNVRGIPKTYIIGPKGRVAYIHTGAIGSSIIAAKLDEARRGLISAQEGKGSYQPINAVTIEELEFLESIEKKGERLQQKSPVRGSYKYRRINVSAVKTYKGRWLKILLKDGVEREGRIVDVKGKVIQLQQSFTSGSFSIYVPIQQIEDIHVLVLDELS